MHVVRADADRHLLLCFLASLAHRQLNAANRAAPDLVPRNAGSLGCTYVLVSYRLRFAKVSCRDSRQRLCATASTSAATNVEQVRVSRMFW